MPNPYFRFKEFTIHHDRCAMKVTTDGCLFGAWCATQMQQINAKNALDIGAGSGLISLMVAQKNEAPIDAVELDESAAQQAKENIAASPWAQNVSVHQCDILSFFPQNNYDVIFSNPPFYEAELASGNVLRSIAHHSGGLRLHQLVAKANDLLAPEGDLFLLMPFKRKTELHHALGNAHLQIVQQVTVHPSARHMPFRLMLHVRKNFNHTTEEQKIYIKDEQNNYTQTFIALLKDYYLYL